ncbi:MAG: cytochrome P450 [Acidimicrobiales bacterium]
MTITTNTSGAQAAKPLPHPPLRRQPSLLRRILADPQPVLDELAAAHGPMYAFGAGPVRMAVVGDPVALRELFAMPIDDFRWGHKFNVLGFVVGAESIIVSDGDDHRRRRAPVQTAFARRRLNGWIPMIVERTDAAIDRVIAGLDGASKQIDMYTVGRSLVLEIAIRSLFGERLAERSDEIGALFQRPQDYLESPAVKQVPHPFPGTKRARVRADRRAIDVIIDAEIAHLRSQPTDDPLDVLGSLVADGKLSDGEIRDQVATLMGAGYDTTSASLSWMFWRASQTDGLWTRLRAEADDVLGPVPAEHVYGPETLAALDLADRTMRETTRLHPAGVISPREAAVDLVVGGYRIPKGTLILWSAHLAGRDERAWIDPLRFDPDRFIDPDPEHKALADIAWVPFGRGVRNCIGFALAQMELTLIIARVAQRLDITATSNDVPRPVGMVVNRPLGGAPMVVGARTSQ